MWLFQFSLAGYYGNSTEPQVIKNKGTYYHIDKFLFYQNYLQPKTSVPFASYVYFCKHFNNYINDYAVDLREIVGKASHPMQIPRYNEELLFDFEGSNEENLKYWEAVFSNSKKNIDPASDFVGEDKIIKKVKKL